MANNINRKPGFYWVRYKQWIIAEWDGTNWTVTHNCANYDDNDWVEINENILVYQFEAKKAIEGCEVLIKNLESDIELVKMVLTYNQVTLNKAKMLNGELKTLKQDISLS